MNCEALRRAARGTDDVRARVPIKLPERRYDCGERLPIVARGGGAARKCAHVTGVPMSGAECAAVIWQDAGIKPKLTVFF